MLQQIGKYSAMFAVIYANAPQLKSLHSSALASLKKKVDRNYRVLLKFNSSTVRSLKMSIENIFCTSSFTTFVTRYNRGAAHSKIAQ
jgi:hypothetical protein